MAAPGAVIAQEGGGRAGKRPRWQRMHLVDRQSREQLQFWKPKITQKPYGCVRVTSRHVCRSSQATRLTGPGALCSDVRRVLYS